MGQSNGHLADWVLQPASRLDGTAASACQKERVVSMSREAHRGDVVVDRSPQAGSGEWWRVTEAMFGW